MLFELCIRVGSSSNAMSSVGFFAREGMPKWLLSVQQLCIGRETYYVHLNKLETCAWVGTDTGHLIAKRTRTGTTQTRPGRMTTIYAQLLEMWDGRFSKVAGNWLWKERKVLLCVTIILLPWKWSRRDGERRKYFPFNLEVFCYFAGWLGGSIGRPWIIIGKEVQQTGHEKQCNVRNDQE